MKWVLAIHNYFPGRRFRAQYYKRAIPPLWVFLRFGFFLSAGFLLLFIGFDGIAATVITLAVIQILSVSLAVFFQELAEGIKRKIETRKKNRQN